MKNRIIISACFCVLTACGGGSSNNGNSESSNGDSGDDVLTGVFLDSAVSGISFTTESQSGITSAEGEFTYLENESVTFSIGEMALPTIAAAPIVTPVDMGENGELDARLTVNIARLLQSIDEDGNPENGIRIPESANAVAAPIDFSLGETDFSNNENVINLVSNSGSSNTTLIGKDEALAHLEGTQLLPITEADLAALYDRQLFLNENFLIVRSNGTYDGTWNGQPMSATWEFRDGFFCRILTEFHNADAIGIEDCQLWRMDVTGTRVRGARDMGNGVDWWYVIGE